ncbi:hypothetical protein [Deinococcus gobiensis]|uniref:hypothetical protein n=1 Tax=Deinococcus gobiensis TaxID=502394 RepID=UPI0011AE66B0|nr:hypothetical protein [Deinococcus gobiensis]
MGQQLEQQRDGNLSPDDRQKQDIDVLLAELSVCTVENELARSAIRQEQQNQPGDVSRTEGMPIKKAFHTTDDRISLSFPREPRRESGVANIFGLNESKDDAGKQLNLIFPIFRKVRGEAAHQGLEGRQGRALFLRVSRKISSP